MLNFRSVFEKAKSFLKENDDYNTEDRIKPLVGTYNAPTLVEVLQIIMKVYEIGEKGDDIEMFGDFTNIMTGFSNIFTSFVNCLTPLCTSLEEDTIVQRLRFIM